MYTAKQKKMASEQISQNDLITQAVAEAAMVAIQPLLQPAHQDKTMQASR